MSKDLIVGAHSIAEALLNPKRADKKIYATEESLKEFKRSNKNAAKVLEGITVELFSNNHKLQQGVGTYIFQLWS